MIAEREARKAVKDKSRAERKENDEATRAEETRLRLEKKTAKGRLRKGSESNETNPMAADGLIRTPPKPAP